MILNIFVALAADISDDHFMFYNACISSLSKSCVSCKNSVVIAINRLFGSNLTLIGSGFSCCYSFIIFALSVILSIFLISGWV